MESVGGFEEDFRDLYEDQVFLTKMCFKAHVFIHHEVLDKYRQHRASHCYQAIKTGEYDPDHPHPARKRYLIWLEEYLRREGAAKSELMAAVQQELWPYRHSLRYVIRSSAAFRYVRKAMKEYLPPRTYHWVSQRLGHHFTVVRKS